MFLAEGVQAVREALASPGVVLELFATAEVAHEHSDLLVRSPVDVSVVSTRAAATLSETITAQGLVAVCRLPAPTLDDVVNVAPRLVVVLVEPNDPGNLGTVIRTADACGADAVVVVNGVDPLNGKAVRASAGSLFHLPVVSASVEQTFDLLAAAGLTTLATSGHGDTSLDELSDGGGLTGPTAWLFGNEARGLAASVLGRAHHTVHVPVVGRAESLNLAATAAICLYASARAQRSA